MREGQQGSRLGATLERTSRLCILVGALALAFYGFGWAEQRIYQLAAARQFEELRQQASQPPAVLPGEPGSAGSGTYGRAANKQHTVTVWGRIEVPRIRLAAMVAEGADDSTLLRAVGHIPGTAWPGQPGNIGLAGHRDTFFRSLGEVRPGDSIRIETLSGSFVYRVRWKRVVTPRTVSVLQAGTVPSLTLVTCYPFHYVGAAPLRFAVRAELDPTSAARH